VKIDVSEQTAPQKSGWMVGVEVAEKPDPRRARRLINGTSIRGKGFGYPVVLPRSPHPGAGLFMAKSVSEWIDALREEPV
jgi:hypothetical protein